MKTINIPYPHQHPAKRAPAPQAHGASLLSKKRASQTLIVSHSNVIIHE